MKKFVLGSMLAVVLAFTSGFSGWKSIEWTPDLVYQTTYCVGLTAGAVVDSRKLPTDVTDNILGGMDRVRSTIPNDGQTFTTTWTPLLDEYLATKTELPDATKALIKTGFNVVTMAIDMKVAEHPEILQSEEYARKAVDGLMNGFMYYVKPSNTNCDDCCRDVETLKAAPQIDYELYKKLDESLRK